MGGQAEQRWLLRVVHDAGKCSVRTVLHRQRSIGCVRRGSRFGVPSQCSQFSSVRQRGCLEVQLPPLNCHRCYMQPLVCVFELHSDCRPPSTSLRPRAAAPPAVVLSHTTDALSRQMVSLHRPCSTVVQCDCRPART